MSTTFDVVIVGSGLSAAVAVAELRRARPETTILVLEAGSAITDGHGEHLIEAANENALFESYENLMRRAKQIEYVNGVVEITDKRDADWASNLRGVFPAAYFGHNFAEFPGGSVAWNIGGMGVHWAAATPWPFAAEIPTFIDPLSWAEDLGRAQQLLQVYSGEIVPNPFAERIIGALRAAVPAEEPLRQADFMPLAGKARAGKPFGRTGPRDVAPEMFDGTGTPTVTLMTNVFCSRVLSLDGTVTGVVGRTLPDGDEETFVGRQYILAADALRTPQLLWASGLRPPALGVGLNEHATLDGDVLIDPDRLGLHGVDAPTPPEGEPFIGIYWSPSIGAARPTHGQLMERNFDGRHVISVGWYCATEIRPENRIEFSDSNVDPYGMPHMTVHFSYSTNDLDAIERTRAVQRAAIERLGELEGAEPAVLPPGASLHYTGTVRMGALDDGTSVCDDTGRVWSERNLFLVGNGVVPTALACNSTLTSATLAVRTARTVAEALTAAPVALHTLTTE